MKKLTATLTVLTLAGALTLTAAAASIKNITASLRPDITVEVDGQTQAMTDANGKRVYALTYNGNVYVPIDALETALGYDADWDDQGLRLTAQARQPGFSSVAGAEKTAAALEQEVDDLKPAATYAGRERQYDRYDEKLEDLLEDLALVRKQVKADYDMGRSTYATYKYLNDRLTKVENLAKTIRTTLEEKTLYLGDDDDSKPSGSGQSYTKQVDDLAKRVDTVTKNVYQYKPAQGANNNKQAFQQLERKLDDLDDEVDRLDDVLEQANRSGTLSNADYRALENLLEQLEQQLDDAADYLEDVLGYDD